MDNRISDEEKKALEWKKVSSRQILKDEWIDFRSAVYRLPDGREIGPFYSYSKKDYVVIAASDEDGNYICVRQFRQGAEKITTEFPAGCIENGEDPLECAKRELKEETGYVSDDWEQLLDICANPTVCSNRAVLFRAGNCKKLSGQAPDPYEFLELKTFKEEELLSLIQSGDFEQADHCLALLYSIRKK